MRKLLAALVAVLFSASAFAAGLPLLPSSPNYSEASQIVGTINAVIQQLNGQAGYATATPIIGTGAYCTNGTGGTTPQICAGQRGAVLFTGLVAAGLAATGTTTTSVITNANVAANSVCTAQWITAFTAGSAIVVATVVPTAGSLSIVSANAGATTNAVTTGTLGFSCSN
jgi:hypothetical protein